MPKGQRSLQGALSAKCWTPLWGYKRRKGWVHLNNRGCTVFIFKKKVSGGEALKEQEFLAGEEQGFCLVIFFYFILSFGIQWESMPPWVWSPALFFFFFDLLCFVLGCGHKWPQQGAAGHFRNLVSKCKWFSRLVGYTLHAKQCQLNMAIYFLI